MEPKQDESGSNDSGQNSNAPGATGGNAAPTNPGGQPEDLSKLSPDELRSRLERVTKEAIDRRHETKDERTKREALEAELKKLKDEAADRERKELEAQGKFKELAEKEAAEKAKLQAELEAVRGKADKFEGTLKKEEETLRSELGELVNAIPSLGSLPLETRVETLRGLAAVKRQNTANTPPAPKVPDPTKGGPTTDAAKLQEERLRIFGDTSMNYVQKAEALKKLNQGRKN